MDKLIERGLLFDFYGELLTEHQQKIYSDAVFNDLSLSELSEEEGISRQGVHDIIKRCDKQLELYEEKLKLVDRFKAIKKNASLIDEIVSADKNMDTASKEKIKGILKSILEEI
ncbi:MAG: DNA-binding protein [Lachnospiraceae bacterium]|nr:DNA-binding protein [Lachnospiraceae bacterium]MBO7600843.1 DNA-binding protein [Lachnospiraceae bacterium]